MVWAARQCGIRGLWKCVSVPAVMYGMDVMRCTENEIAKLDVVKTKLDEWLWVQRDGWVWKQCVVTWDGVRLRSE